MNPSIIIKDLNGSRTLSDQQLPLNIGTEEDAHIRLPSWAGSGSLAQISILDERCFVQPQNQQVKLLLNGVSLVKPGWLDDGDVLTIGDADIALHDEGYQLEFEVFLSSEEAETVPPQLTLVDSDAPYDLAREFIDDGLEPPDKSAAVETEQPEGVHVSQIDTAPGISPEDSEDHSIESVADEDYQSPSGPLSDSPSEAIADSLHGRRKEPILEPLPNSALRKPETAPVRAIADRKKRRSGVMFFWLLLVVLVAYLLVSSKVTVSTLPAGAVVNMEKLWLAPGINGRYMLLPGDYNFVVRAEGYEPASGSVSVSLLERKNVNITLAEKPGRFDLNLPADASGELWVDGQRVAALSELPVPLSAGAHEYRIVTDLYQDYSGSVDIAGRDALQTMSAELVPDWGSLAIATDPPGAEVYLGERFLGTTPATVDVLAGTHDIELRLQGYKTLVETLDSLAGQVDVLPMLELQRAEGLIQIESTPSDAAVSVDGTYIGNTPLSVDAPPDQTLEVVVSKPGYGVASRSIAVDGSEPLRIEIPLITETGVLVVETSPDDAFLYVDGKLRGAATQSVELSAVAHEIEIRKPGYQTWATKVTPTPGVAQRVDVTLLTAAQVALSSLPLTNRSSLGQQLNLITPGEFRLGSRAGEPGRRANEVLRSVRLQRPFYIGTKEVTNREFEIFNPRHRSATEEFADLGAPDKPVVMVTWGEAAAFCNWLSDREGLARAYLSRGGRLQLADSPNDGYRLPTEAEWAWVARYSGGLGERRFPWGAAMPPVLDSGNYADESAMAVVPNAVFGYNDGFITTAPVGSFSPNALGIFDLGGNVAEWVNDWYSATASGMPAIDPVGPAQGQNHVIRGSGWRHANLSDLRLAARDSGESARIDVGFRLARYAQPITTVSEPALVLGQQVYQPGAVSE